MRFTFRATLGEQELVNVEFDAADVAARLPGLCDQIISTVGSMSGTGTTVSHAADDVLTQRAISHYMTHVPRDSRMRSAAALMSGLFRSVPSVAFVCLTCKQDRGVCRCGSHGITRDGEWVYMGDSSMIRFPGIVARSWCIKVPSIGALSEDEIGLLTPRLRESCSLLQRALQAEGA